MTARIVEIHRVLKPTGSFYLHCDPTASHYLKIITDSIFCAPNGEFVNEIIWCYSIGGKSKKRFGKKHDVLLFYTKSSDNQHMFNIDGASIARKPNSHMRTGKDEDGRLYQEKTDRKSGKVYRYYLDQGKIAEDYWTDIETLNREDKERSVGLLKNQRRCLIELSELAAMKVIRFWMLSVGAVQRLQSPSVGIVDGLELTLHTKQFLRS